MSSETDQVMTDSKASVPRKDRAANRRRKGKVPRKFPIKTMIVLIAVLASAVPLKHYFWRGVPDYSGKNPGKDVIVDIKGDTLTAFGKILLDNGVVASIEAFNKAAGTHSVSAGYYNLPTHISGKQAVDMLTDPEMKNRVGRIVIPDGTQLESKRTNFGKTIPGIFSHIASASCFQFNQQHFCGTTEQALTDAAAHASLDQLGVPLWAREHVQSILNSPRRIEGLIRPGTWEGIDPRLTPVQMLRSLITSSVEKYESDGILDKVPGNNFSPYELLTAASIVVRETKSQQDYPKVARVIVNRLAKDQMLQMDSTINYDIPVIGIDINKTDVNRETKWNTYAKYGLPATPIGSPNDAAIEAALKPAPGNWLYFVTIDNKGTTLFTDNYDRQRQNRNEACQNHFLASECNGIDSQVPSSDDNQSQQFSEDPQLIPAEPGG